MTYRPIGKSYFSGCGGLDGSLIESGCEIIQSLEYDPHCCATLRKNFSHARLQGFPDWFKFAGGSRQAYKQIGNAVAWDMGRWAGKSNR